jgi:hypothetical protein
MILEQESKNPGSEAYYIAVYLPNLVRYIVTELRDPVDYAYFKDSFIRRWETTLPGIPVPDFEGVSNYITMIRKFRLHLHKYRDRVLEIVGDEKSIQSSTEIEGKLNAVINEILFGAIQDLLKMRGDI